MRRVSGAGLLSGLVLFLCGGAGAAQQTPTPSLPDRAASKALTVDRIYSEPSLSGRPIAGIAWAPDARQISFLQGTPSQQGKESKTELLAMDVATGKISTTSPIGRALLNKKVGDEVIVDSPNGKREMEILSLSTIHDEIEPEKAGA